MPFFRINEELEAQRITTLRGGDVRHIIGSRRIKVGQSIIVQTPAGIRHQAQITAVSHNSLQIEPQSIVMPPALPAVRVRLLMASIKEIKPVITKAVEIGVESIGIFEAHFSVARRIEQSKLQRIAWEACKQCGRHTPPPLTKFASLDEALSAEEDLESAWMLDPSGEPLLKKSPPTKQNVIIIGPEGGFEQQELEQAARLGITRISLGEQLLRADTAAIVACSLVLWG